VDLELDELENGSIRLPEAADLVAVGDPVVYRNALAQGIGIKLSLWEQPLLR